VASLLAMAGPLVSTGEAARALGIGRSTLARWHAEGTVEAAFITAGGHARWDVEDLRRQIAEWRRRQAAEADE
jgi:excisionase family DNA binding protein